MDVARAALAGGSSPPSPCACLCKGLKPPLLEVGVGTGRFAQALGIEYGVDISSGVLKFAKKREITVVKGAGEELPFKDKVFGGVFLIVTLCFVDAPLKVLKESARVLSARLLFFPFYEF